MSFQEVVASGFDFTVNRVLGTYVGAKPTRPRELIIPSFVIIEKGELSILDHLKRLVSARLFDHAVIFADDTTWGIAGERLSRELAASFRRPQRIIVGSNRYIEVERAVTTLSRAPRWWAGDREALNPRVYGPKKASILIAVGGGTVIDVAKLVARQLHVPCVSVPTSLANDGIASPFAVIDPGARNPDLAQTTVEANTPLGVIISLPNIMPAQGRSPFFRTMIQSGVGDLLSNLTAVMDWQLAASDRGEHIDYVALLESRGSGEGILNRLLNGQRIDDDEFILTLAAALVASGEAMTRVGSSRPASGFDHKLYHAYRNLLKIETRASHGVLVAVGALISAHCHQQLYEPLRQACAKIGLPTTRDGLREMDIDPEGVERAIRAAPAIKPDRYTILEALGAEPVVESFRRVFS